MGNEKKKWFRLWLGADTCRSMNAENFNASLDNPLRRANKPKKPSQELLKVDTEGTVV
jgi:hypothetical protein